MAIMAPHQFSLEAEKFGPGKHKYWSDGKDGTPSAGWARHLSAEYTDLAHALPMHMDSSIFMRVHESRMGYAQMMIVAPPETPYAGGCFLFDIHFPSNYPQVPPHVNLQTTGGGSHRFNPNLYNCGKVCLSILGTWSGQKGESWNPKSSTFLQIAVSLQSLVFVKDPYFNEPGYESSMGTPSGTSSSDAYSKDQQQATVRFAMIDMLKTPPLNFETVVRAHFYLQQKRILETVEKWAKTNTAITSTHIESLKSEFAKLKAPEVVKPTAE